ncbi:MAG: DUF3990 domain-containing protein [Faecalimonas sp.]|nr:DUF3990 domain-containing protein [Faecalimonas sp.]
MVDYQIIRDMEIAQELLGWTDEELAGELGVTRATLNRWRIEKRVPIGKIDLFYSQAFQNRIRLNRIKEQFYREDYTDDSHRILFHGAKSCIDGRLSLEKSRKNNDFGQGFYCGESLEQSAMFVANYKEASLYMVRFCKEGLRKKVFGVNRDWMLLIAHCRGRLSEFADSPLVEKLLRSIKDIDYIVAPIADNRMFEIIDSFIEGEITDVQCQHCLSATNLGSQYVFLTEAALEQVHILERCYLAQEEKESYLQSHREYSEVNRDKVKIARRQYRGQGKYIEEILK